MQWTILYLKLAEPPGVAREKNKVDNETNVTFFKRTCRLKGVLSVYSST